MGRSGWADRLRHEWLPPTGRHSAVLGAILIALVWISAHLFFENERLSAEQAAIQNSENLAGAFDEHLSRSIWEIDRSLQIARTRYLRDPETFELYEWLKATPLFPNEALQITVIDRDGFLKLSSADPAIYGGIDLRDREHFRTHVHSQRDDLFISKPLVLRSTGLQSVQLARRITNQDGSFGGVIVAALDPSYLTRIYNTVNTGVDGFIRVIGVVRATSGQGTSMLGKDLSAAGMFQTFPKKPRGWYYTKSGISDGIPRLISYRAVTNYPLIIMIGRSTREIFARLESQRRNGHLIAAGLTLLILSATAFSLRGHWQRAKSKRSLEQSNMLLNATLEHIPVGVCMFGADRKLVLANDLYSTMYGLDPAGMHSNITGNSGGPGRGREQPEGLREISQGPSRGLVQSKCRCDRKRVAGRTRYRNQPSRLAGRRAGCDPSGHYDREASRRKDHQAGALRQFDQSCQSRALPGLCRGCDPQVPHAWRRFCGAFARPRPLQGGQ
jgi:PAS domain-containing protein